MSKLDLGIVIGRFQPLHKGHIRIINEAILKCNRVAVFVGSSQEEGTQRNPFSFKLRKRMLESVFGCLITVLPLPDVGLGDCPEWGNYILEQVKKHYNKRPDLMVFGNDEVRNNWFDKEDIDDIVQIVVKREYFPISATEVRKSILNDDRKTFEKRVPYHLHDMYGKLRKILLKIEKENS